MKKRQCLFSAIFGRRRQQAAMIFFCTVFGLALALVGCGKSDESGPNFNFKDPSGEPIKAAVRTALPLAYAASVAFASINGINPPNATVSNNCSAYPCTARVTVTDDDSATPLKYAAYGTITVYGYWTSADQAILAVSFDSMSAGSGLFPVHDVSLFPVSKKGSHLLVVYESVDINTSVGPTDPGTLTQAEIDLALVKLNITTSSEPSQNINMEAWIVDVDDVGTSAFSDDTYTISGGGQYITASAGSASLLQLGMAYVGMGPGCALNPVAGLSVINELETSSSNVVLGTALISSEPACDGTAKVTVATGNYLQSIGKSIPLNLVSP